MKKNYNNTRPRLHLPEYGRHIQSMVQTLSSIEDRAERNKQARAVIAVMGNLNPLLRDTPIFTHKLWDHLFMMSDFQLDVDSPYDQPTREELEVKPKKLNYPQRRIAHKHYGKYVAAIVKSLKDESPENIATTLDNITVYMRAKSYEYNQEHPNNEAIIKDIKRMADGSIEIDEKAINNIQSDYKQHSSAYPQKGQQRTNGRMLHKNRGFNNPRNNNGTNGSNHPHSNNYTNNHPHNNNNKVIGAKRNTAK